jgi:hypothetical protein
MDMRITTNPVSEINIVSLMRQRHMRSLFGRAPVRLNYLHNSWHKRCLSNDSTLTPLAKQPLYLHVGPSGDCWTGASIFAAKHLQPDYVKSIKLPSNVSSEEIEQLLENDIELAKQIYDSLDISVLLGRLEK